MSWWKAAVCILGRGQAEKKMMEDKQSQMISNWEGFFRLSSAGMKHADVCIGEDEHFATTS